MSRHRATRPYTLTKRRARHIRTGIRLARFEREHPSFRRLIVDTSGLSALTERAYRRTRFHLSLVTF